MTVYYGKELYHHGIKGQKWGVRRFQNEDGSVTPAGRQRYGYGPEREKYLNAKAAYKLNKKSIKANTKAEYNRISDDYNNKIEKLESKYKRGQSLSDEDLATQDKYADQLMKDTAKAKSDYKQALKDNKQALRDARKEYWSSEEGKARLKKYAITGVAIAGTALAAYGAYKIYQNGQLNKRVTDYANAGLNRTKKSLAAVENNYKTTISKGASYPSQTSAYNSSFGQDRYGNTHVVTAKARYDKATGKTLTSQYSHDAPLRVATDKHAFDPYKNMRDIRKSRGKDYASGIKKEYIAYRKARGLKP